MKSFLADVLVIAGTLSISYGAWLVSPPGGFVVAGAILMVVGVRLNK